MGEVPLRGRIRGAVARWLAVLPPALQVRLSRVAPIRVDGQTLDPTLQLWLSLRPEGRSLAGGTPAQARARHRREMLALRGRSTPVASVRDLEVDGGSSSLRARHYAPAASGDEGPQPLLVYFHGGGFLLGDLDTHDETCRILCRAGRQHVLSVEYRLAPEHPFPAATDDAEAAFRWARANAGALGADPGRVAVGGDSAGGNLAAVVAQTVRGAERPVAQLLIYPPTDRTSARPSTSLFDGFFLSRADRETFGKHYYGGSSVAESDVRISPLRAQALGDLPPALLVTAGFDVLRDEGEEYAEAIRAAGGHCDSYREPSLGHGFVQLACASGACRDATVRLAKRWRELLDAVRSELG